ncbi:MAG TPA: hypothetical protein VF433_14255, partial [Cellvibrio sp.]
MSYETPEKLRSSQFFMALDVDYSLLVFTEVFMPIRPFLRTFSTKSRTLSTNSLTILMTAMLALGLASCSSTTPSPGKNKQPPAKTQAATINPGKLLEMANQAQSPERE